MGECRVWRESSETLRLTAGLSVGTAVGGEVWGLGALGGRERLCLLAEYPDERVERHRARGGDWHEGRLATRLVLSASLWTHKAPVAVALAKEARPEDEDLMRAVDRKELADRRLTIPLPNQLGRTEGLNIFLHPRPPT